LWVGGPVPLGYATVNKKLVIVPEEAETVRAMFRLYLECGSVGALSEELARRNIVSKVRTFASGRVKGGGPSSVGALAHFLKNRFYIGEVVYRGETHTGEHASIINRPTFDAVQAKLAENAHVRRVRVQSSPAILMGRIFDDRGNRMTPSHSNKDGVRYRYYVPHSLLQRRKKDAGRVTRVPAIQLEKLVVEAIRAEAWLDTEPKGDLSDRAVIDSYVARIIVRPDSIDIELREPTRPGAIAGCSRKRRRGGIIHLHHRHQPALERASVPFRQGNSASARGQADAQTRDPGRDSPRRSQGARLD
jgi:site-specific DNA recombinase